MTTSSVLFWNIWGHRDPKGIHEYLERNKDTLDVCCLTEVTSMGKVYDPAPSVHTSTDRREPASGINGLEQLTSAFGSDFELRYNSPYFRRWECQITHKRYNQVGFGSLLLIKKGFSFLYCESAPILRGVRGVKERVLQSVVYEVGGKHFIVAHLHGVWLKHNTKGNDPFRDQQSYQVLENLWRLSRMFNTHRIIFGGDLNLDLSTSAVALIESGGDLGFPFKNIIREYEIENTRTPAYRKYGHAGESRYADYVFVSPSVRTRDFVVDNNVVASDHAPLMVTFN